MSRVTKTQQLELAQDEIAALKDELARRDREHENEIDEFVGRAIVRNSEYEAEIRRYREGLDEIGNLATEAIEEINNRVLDARARATFLAQGIVTALSYGGGDIAYLQDFLTVLVDEWLPVEEIEEEE